MTYRILIVDDDADLITLHRWIFARNGFEVSVATNVGDALRLTHEVHPHLVLTDCMMPGMSGLEICRQIRLQPELANVPIVILSASGGKALRRAAQLAGATGYWEKPIRPRELLEKVRQVLTDSSN